MDFLPQVQQLALQGHSAAEISEKTKIALSTVKRWLKEPWPGVRPTMSTRRPRLGRPPQSTTSQQQEIMRKLNHRLAQARQRKKALLPRITRLSLKGHTTREIAAKAGVPKTTALRWLQSLRGNCATQAAAEAAEMIDNVAARYDEIYRKALKGWDRSQADKEIRTVVESGDDDAKKKRSVRTETQAGNAAFLAQARAAVDSIRKLKRLDLPVEAETSEAGDDPIQAEALKEDDLAE